MKILLVAATPFEIAPFLEHLKASFIESTADFYTKGALSIRVCVTGVGVVATTFELSKQLQREHYQLVINAGIAGSFSPAAGIGAVANVISERFGDLGVEEKDGSFSDIFDLQLGQPNVFPFENGILKNKATSDFSFLKSVNGLTVNKVHGHERTIEKIKEKYPEAVIETMEGAAVFYVCLKEGINFLEIRSVSNFVEPRNKENWDLPLAIRNLNEVLVTLVSSL